MASSSAYALLPLSQSRGAPEDLSPTQVDVAASTSGLDAPIVGWLDRGASRPDQSNSGPPRHRRRSSSTLSRFLPKGARAGPTLLLIPALLIVLVLLLRYVLLRGAGVSRSSRVSSKDVGESTLVTGPRLAEESQPLHHPEWVPEEIALRNWTWGPYEPHRSLLTNIAKLSHVSRAVSHLQMELN